MELDISVCLKSLRDVFHQFRSSQTEQAKKDLERELDLLIGIATHGDETNLKNFCPQTLLHADSLSILVSILNDANLKSSIYSKAMVLLSCLAASHKIRKSLQDTFKLTPTLVNFLVHYSLTSDQTVILQGLQLLQQVTYGIQIKIPLGEVENLIKYLVSKIVSPESNLTIPCLGSLATICRSNAALQDYIRDIVNVKAFFKKLTGFLSNDNWLKIIHSLSILLIFISEPLGEKIFSRKNINEIFQLAFNALLKGEGQGTKKYSCDLFIDLVRCRRMQKHLAANIDLHSRLKDVVGLLKKADEESTEKILELLIELCQVPALQTVAVDVLFGNTGNKAKDTGGELGCLLTIISVVSSRQETGELRSTYFSLKLVKKLYTLVFSSGRSQEIEEIQLNMLLPVLSKILILKEEKDSSMWTEVFRNSRMAIKILILLCKASSAVSSVSHHLDVTSLSNVVLDLCSRFESNLKHLSITEEDCGNVISSVVIGLIQLISLVETHLQVEEGVLRSILQSNALIPFLANCLSSRSKTLIESCMEILSKARDIPDFSTAGFCELLASNNKAVFNIEADMYLKHPPAFDNTPEIPSYHPNSAGINGTEDDKDVAALVERTASALEIRDEYQLLEIMDIYEHKLAAIKTKESHLNSLLDSKTAALSNAHGLLAEYRCLNAQSEAECLKLRALFLQSQKSSVKRKAQIEEYMKELNVMETEIERMCEAEKSLQAISEEYDQLKNAFEDQAERLSTAQDNLAAAEEEQTTLSEMNDMLRKHTDNLKSQLDCSQQQLKDREKENQNVSARLKEKDKKYEELAKELGLMEERSRDGGRERQELENRLKVVEEKLENSENDRNELCHKIDAMQKENKCLLQIAEEHEQLKTTFKDQNQRLETARRSLEVADAENSSLSDMNSMLRKQGENAKIKYEGVLQQLKETEKEKLTISQKLKDREKKNEVSMKSLANLKEEIKVGEKERLEIQQKLKTTEKQSRQIEKAKSELSHKVSSLTLLNQKYEKEIQEKEGKIKELKSQLDKQSQIAAMIHNLSSGKVAI